MTSLAFDTYSADRLSHTFSDSLRTEEESSFACRVSDRFIFFRSDTGTRIYGRNGHTLLWDEQYCCHPQHINTGIICDSYVFLSLHDDEFNETNNFYDIASKKLVHQTSLELKPEEASIFAEDRLYLVWNGGLFVYKIHQ